MQGVPTQSYLGGWIIERVCPKCARFIKLDKFIKFNGLGIMSPNPNATCKRCGRVRAECIEEGEI